MTENITSEVLSELERAMRKFPTWPTDPLHALAVLGEEFGELTKDVLQLTYEPHKTDAANVRKEALQTAAMALRFAASLDAYQYQPGVQHAQSAMAGAQQEPNHTQLLALWNHSCGSSQHLWHGPTLEEAAAVWRELYAKGETAELTAWGRGIIATHEEMLWKFGAPKGTFACPICEKETPHQHSAEVVAFHRDNEAHRQRAMEKRWEEISTRIASITGTAGA